MTTRPPLGDPNRDHGRNVNDPLDLQKHMLATNVQTYLGVVKTTLGQQGVLPANDSAASLLLEVAAEFLRSDGRDETLAHLKEIIDDVINDRLRARSY